MLPFRTALSLLALPLLLGTARADIVHVANTGSDAVQLAIDLSQPGDVLLIEPGTYRAVIVPHGLTLMADGGDVLITNTPSDPATMVPVDVQGPGTGVVRLVGLDIRRQAAQFFARPALTAAGVDQLQVVDCRVFHQELSSADGGYVGPAGMTSVAPLTYVADSLVDGGDGASFYLEYPLPGGKAASTYRLLARNSRLVAGTASAGYFDTNAYGRFCAESLDLLEASLPPALSCSAIVRQDTFLSPGIATELFCCQFGTAGLSTPCFALEGERSPFGNEPVLTELPDFEQSPVLQGVPVDLPANLRGAATARLGETFRLTTETGASGGLLLVGSELLSWEAVEGFGNLMVHITQIYEK